MSTDVRNVNLVNFGAELSKEVLAEIEKEHRVVVKQVLIKSSLNLKKHSTLIQVHDLVAANRKHFTESDFFIVNLPGLPIYAAFLIVEIHALTGRFPILIECLKDYAADGIFTSFKFKRLYDLDRERTQSRENFKGCE